MNNWINARHCSDRVFQRPSLLTGLINKDMIRWAGRFHALGKLPGMISNVHVSGYDRLPLREQPAPILSFSHKKLHDVFTIVDYMAGRPLDRFHEPTIVAMAGLFDGFYAYRDLLPDILKMAPLRPAAVLLGRSLGRSIRSIFESLNAHPVYRDGSDIPTREQYESAQYSGRSLTGMNYDDFLRRAAKETLNSVVAVQRELAEKNRTFLILPEGRYLHDGQVAEFRDFVGVMAFRKKRALALCGISYDEFCPDALGRVEAWVHTMSPLAPPESRSAIPTFLNEARDCLQSAAPLLATHAIAAALKPLLDGREFLLDDVQLAANEHMQRFAAALLPKDPALQEEARRAERWRSFLRARQSQWMEACAGNRWRLRLSSIDRFARTERSVNDILWNYNCVAHFWDESWRSRAMTRAAGE
ncbi:MAG: hypothetical protein K1X75_04860 [Leptospirales bacterium]|nr:hypothetical protein [Leptospirales bacterium]